MAKKTTYINAELDWAEQQLISWKEYVDANPLHKLDDRVKYKETSNGGQIPMVVARKICTRYNEELSVSFRTS